MIGSCASICSSKPAYNAPQVLAGTKSEGLIESRGIYRRVSCVYVDMTHAG
jgi:hypothetical protein